VASGITARLAVTAGSSKTSGGAEMRTLRPGVITLTSDIERM
jgi:hypothetical protein